MFRQRTRAREESATGDLRRLSSVNPDMRKRGLVINEMFQTPPLLGPTFTCAHLRAAIFQSRERSELGDGDGPGLHVGTAKNLRYPLLRLTGFEAGSSSESAISSPNESIAIRPDDT